MSRKVNQVKLPWSFRIRQAWELIVHGTDTRYDQALSIIEEQGLECARLEAELDGIAKAVIVPPLMTEQARQMMHWQDRATKALRG